VFKEQRRTKPPTIIDVVANPFTRSLGKRPNQGERSLWDNPNVGSAGGTFHCLPARITMRISIATNANSSRLLGIRFLTLLNASRVKTTASR
jgi:hypothetical protein